MQLLEKQDVSSFLMDTSVGDFKHSILKITIVNVVTVKFNKNCGHSFYELLHTMPDICELKMACF